MNRILLLAVLSWCVCVMGAEAAEYGVVRTPAPVLNKPDFEAVFGGTSGHDLKTDRCGQVRELEYIALPGAVFTLLKKLRSGGAEMYQVETDEYQAAPGVRLYVDARFLSLEFNEPPPRQPSLPARAKIVSALRAAVGSPYVWGGNVMDGVPGLVAWFYGGKGERAPARNSLAGLDCSGLLYHATHGWTPRNTSQLISFGQGVVIAGKQPAEIAALLQPLDLIVWNGHVIIVLDGRTAIESRLECGKPRNGGVVTTPLLQRLAEIMRTRRPANAWPGENKRRDMFVVRRWYGMQ